MSATNRESFHARLASVVEVLANAAVAEICRLVDDGYAVLRLEISHNQREIDGLRRKLLLARVQSSRRAHLERLGALRRTGHVSRWVGKSKSSAEFAKADGKTTRQHREPEVPVVVKLESNGHRDSQPQVSQGCETPAVVSADSPSTYKPDSRSIRVQPENQKSLHKLTCDAEHIFQSHPPAFSSQLSSETTNWDQCCPISNSGGAFACTTSCHDDNSFINSSQWTEASADKETWSNMVGPHNPIQGKHAEEPPNSQSPVRQQAKTKSDGSGTVDILGAVVSSDLGNVVPHLADSLDWNPDGGMQGSLPIKEEEDMNSRWGLTNGITRSRGVSAERRQQRDTSDGDGERKETGVEGERRGEMDAANSNKYFPLQLRDAQIANRITENYFQPTPDNTKALSSCSSSSSSSFSILTTDKSARQVLHPQSNRGGRAASGGQHHHFRCELCGKTFTKFPSLRRHQRVHTGEKPFSCRHCSKCFSHRHQMKNHERVHTGEKPFRCPVCGRCFVQSNHMKRHLSIHSTEHRATS